MFGKDKNNTLNTTDNTLNEDKAINKAEAAEEDVELVAVESENKGNKNFFKKPFRNHSLKNEVKVLNKNNNNNYNKNRDKYIPVKEVNTKKPKMSIEEYIEYRNLEYKHSDEKRYRFILNSLIAILGLVIIAILVSICLKFYEINEYVFYGVVAGSVLFFILFYIVPIIRIQSMKKFELEFGRKEFKRAKKNNKALCFAIRDRLIDIEDNAICEMNDFEYNTLKNAKEDEIEIALYNAYNHSIKRKAKQIIRKYTKKCSIFTALSQTGSKDALIIASFNIAMIRELIYLYGFRPNDSKMYKIIIKIMTNVFLSLGINEFPIGSTITSGLAKVLPNKLDFLSGILGKTLESIGQGIVNGIFINTIGKETIKYLLGDYELQYKLSLVDIISDEEHDAKRLYLNSKEMKELNDASNKFSEEAKKDYFELSKVKNKNEE